MNLDEAQKKKVADWIAAGLKLSEIQSRIGSELGVVMTYMEVRLLADDLKLTPRDIEPPKTVPATLASKDQATPSPQGSLRDAEPPDTGAPGKSVSIDVDKLARPGAVVSGKVVFTDGVKAEWYFDQNGRLGLVPQQAGYRPSTEDLRQFQAALEFELSRLGL
jgi:hypothetical protein